jgi:hypothetical protein
VGKSPEKSFHELVLSVTLVIMAVIMRSLLERPNAEALERVISVAIGAISGLGLYEAICKLVEFLLGRSERVKSNVLGRSYVEGKWYGFYTYSYEENGQSHIVVHLLIEDITQEWENVSINGRAFSRTGQPHGQWSSTSARALGGQSQLEIRAVANLSSGHFDSARTMQLEGKPPHHMCGFVFDTVASHRPGKAWWEAWKPKNPLSDADALVEAERHYKQFLLNARTLSAVQ